MIMKNTSVYQIAIPGGDSYTRPEMLIYVRKLKPTKNGKTFKPAMFYYIGRKKEKNEAGG